MRTRPVLLPLLAAACLLTFVACAPHVPNGVPVLAIPTAPPGALDCPSTLVTASSAMGSQGGTLSAGGHRLHLPPGAVQGTVPFTLHRHRSGYGLVQVLPAGQQFSSPATLTLSYAHCRGGPRDGLRAAIFRWEPQRDAWVEVDSSRHDPEARTVTAPIPHLTGYAIGGV
jgi:hypothetical protein